MKKTVVIFESKYGFTKNYAEWIAEALSCPLIEKKKFLPEYFKKYDIILYGGGLYAGGVSGIALITQNLTLLSDKELILFTCGLADPAAPENVTHIRKSLSQALPAEVMRCIKIFHLRGGINYPGLSFVHKAMMSMLRRMLLKKSPSELSDEEQLLLETYGKQIDFTDRNTIQPIIDYVESL